MGLPGFSATSCSIRGRGAEELVLIVSPQENQLAPWMLQTVKISPDLDDVTKVEFSGCTIPVSIVASRGLDTRRCGPASIRLSRLDVNNKPFPDETFGSLTWNSKVPLRLPVQWKLPGMSPGKYRLVIDVSGCARWDSGPIEVRDGMKPVIARLVQGSGVVFEKGLKYAFDGPVLLRGEEEVSERYLVADGAIPQPGPAIFAGLPFGKYRLRVPFFERVERGVGVPERSEELVAPPKPRYWTVEFEVGSTSPPLLKFEENSPGVQEGGR